MVFGLIFHERWIILKGDMKSIFVSILLASLFVTTITIGGMTFFEMDHGMGASDTMICIEHCLQAFSSDTIVPTLLPFLFIIALFLFSGLREGASGVLVGHSFQRWRESIGIFLRHQHLSTIVFLD